MVAMTTGGTPRTEPLLRPARNADRPAILALLDDARLPTADVDHRRMRFVVGEAASALVAAAAIEGQGASRLLRSVVVAPEWRGRGLGRRLVEHLMVRARGQGVGTLYLLTTDAQPFFATLGFAPLERASVPASVRRSQEFRGACPVSATVMQRSLADGLDGAATRARR
jgi:amino-acid N-acetyltransferase